MNETDYRQDYIVTWTDEISPTEVQEGFAKRDLAEWEGENDIDKIKTMYAAFNKGIRLPLEKRVIVKIETVTRKTIL